MSKAREFHIGTVLSVVTPKLVSPDGMFGVQEFVEFMAGEPIWTHQLVRVAKECRQFLLEQHPFLVEIDASIVTQDNWLQWLNQQIEEHGSLLSVRPLPPNRHERIDPVSELAETAHPDRIMVVKT